MKHTTYSYSFGFFVMNYKTIKIALLLFTILPLTHICAHEASFRTFLSEHEKVNCIDSVSFGKAFDFIEDVERYSDFLPPTDDRYNGSIYPKSVIRTHA